MHYATKGACRPKIPLKIDVSCTRVSGYIYSFRRLRALVVRMVGLFCYLVDGGRPQVEFVVCSAVFCPSCDFVAISGVFAFDALDIDFGSQSFSW